MNCKAIPDYAKSFKKEYVFLLGIDEAFSYLFKGIGFHFIGYGSLKKVSSWIDKINIFIKKCKVGLDSGVFKDLSEEEINFEAFSNIESVEQIVGEHLNRYAYLDSNDNYKIDKKKYEDNVGKDFPGLRKLVDTLSYYDEVIKYKKTYNLPNSVTDTYIDSDSDSDSDSDDYYSKDELKQFLYFINGVDSDE